MAADRRVLLANSIYHLTNDGATAVFAGQIALLQIVFRFGAFETGLLVGTALLVNAGFQVLFGIMSDRRDPSRFLPIGIAIVGVATLAIAASQTFLMLLVIVSLARIGASFYHPVGISWIGREFQGEQLDRSMGFQSAFGDGGEILGMASAAVLGVAVGWWLPFVLWGCINLAAVVLGLSLVAGHPSPPVSRETRSVVDYLGALKDVRLWLIPLAVGGASFNIIANFGPPLLHNKFGFGADAAGVAIALWILVGTIAAFSFGKLSRRFGRFRILLFAFAATGLASLAGAVIDNSFVLLACLWTLGSALFLTYPALFSFASEASHRKLQGAAFGLIFFFQLIGGAVGAFAAGTFAELFGSSPSFVATIPFCVGAVFSLTGAGYLVLVRSRLKMNAREGAVAGPIL